MWISSRGGWVVTVVAWQSSKTAILRLPRFKSCSGNKVYTIFGNTFDNDACQNNLFMIAEMPLWDRSLIAVLSWLMNYYTTPWIKFKAWGLYKKTCDNDVHKRELVCNPFSRRCLGNRVPKISKSSRRKCLNSEHCTCFFVVYLVLRASLSLNVTSGKNGMVIVGVLILAEAT